MINSFEDTLAECLDALQRGQATVAELLARYPEYQEELQPLLLTFDRINRTPQVAPRVEFSITAKQKLLSQLKPRIPVQPRQPSFRAGLASLRNSLWVSALVAVLLVCLVGVGTASASYQAIPGDALYPVKLNIETFQMSLTSGSQAVNLELNFSARRLQEVNALVARGRYDQLPAALTALNISLSDAVARYDALPDASNTHPDQLFQAVDTSVAHNITVLQNLLTRVPDSAKPAIEHAIAESSKNDIHYHGPDKPWKDQIPGLGKMTDSPTSTDDLNLGGPGDENGNQDGGSNNGNHNQGQPAIPPGQLHRTATAEPGNPGMPSHSAPADKP